MNEKQAVKILCNFISVCNCMTSDEYRVAFKALKILEESVIVISKVSTKEK